MAPETLRKRLGEAAARFRSLAVGERGGRDPVAELYAERRRDYSLFSLQLGDADCEALRPYLFGQPIPRKAGDRPVTCLNLVDGEWRRTAELAPRHVPRRSPRDALRAGALARERLRVRDRPGPRLLVVARVGQRRRSPIESTSSRTSRASCSTSTRSASTSCASRRPRRGSRPTRTSGRPSARPITSRATPRRR